MLSKPNLTDQLMNINEMYKSANRSSVTFYTTAKLYICLFSYKLLVISILISDMIYMHLIFDKYISLKLL